MHGSSDAGESDDRAAIGGWFSDVANPNKMQVWWFALDVSRKRRIAALELLGGVHLAFPPGKELFYEYRCAFADGQ